MLSCRGVAERANAMIDGDLGGWEAATMRLHLLLCRGCARFLRQMRATQDMTEAVASEAVTQPEAADARFDALLSELRNGKPSAG